MTSFGFDFHERDVPPSSEELATAWRQYIEPCIEAFGANRCMFESNSRRTNSRAGTPSCGTLSNALQQTRRRAKRRRFTAALRRGCIALRRLIRILMGVAFVRSIRAVVAAALIGIAAPALAEPDKPNWLNYQEGDFIIKDYKFASGEALSQLKLHYRTLGSAERDGAGEIVNSVLLLQGNTGTGANSLRPTLANELFKEGEPLDVGRYFIIIPDALGRGGSSKPLDGLKGSFPHYRYHDMVDSVHRLVTEGRKVAHLRLVIGSSLGCTVLCGPRCILT
jgi:hypothetical protein